jgi:hypothetical protein
MDLYKADDVISGGEQTDDHIVGFIQTSAILPLK